MHRYPQALAEVAQEVDALYVRREAVLAEGFERLRQGRPKLAEMLIAIFGDGHKASHWLCTHQKRLDCRTAWQALADGDEESLWDILEVRV
jgi:hypothetical protein